MSFLHLVRREMQGSLRRLVFVSVLGGISNAAILAAINSGSRSFGNQQETSLWAAALFVIALLLFIKTQHYVVITCAVEIEAIIHKLRVRIMEGIRQSELLSLEKIGRSRIVAAITSDTTIIKQASSVLVFGLQGLVLIFFVSIYVAYLSLAAFAMSIAIIGIAAVNFQVKSRHLTIATRQAEQWGNRLYDRLSDLLDGFKEVRLNSARSKELFEDASEVSRTAANIKIWTDAETFKQLVTTQSFIYLLLGAVVFLAPALSQSLGSASIAKTTTALLFVVGACFGVVQSVPVLMAADAAAERIETLEADLRTTAVSPDVGSAERRQFGKIEFKDIVFRYVDKFSNAEFQVGPINLALEAGELVFISGGNGSGKSTLLKVIAGLYPPDSGEIIVDGTRVDDGTRAGYRQLIAAIFTDYHLFKRLYGVPDPDLDEVERLFTEFRLRDKTGLTDGVFRTLDLSGGQRKRLALFVSLLEKRPLLLLDEWTSDQDPEFRRKFYDDLLPAMQQTGATVVAVTHDDRHLNAFRFAARKLRMDDGRIVE